MLYDRRRCQAIRQHEIEQERPRRRFQSVREQDVPRFRFPLQPPRDVRVESVGEARVNFSQERGVAFDLEGEEDRIHASLGETV